MTRNLIVSSMFTWHTAYGTRIYCVLDVYMAHIFIVYSCIHGTQHISHIVIVSSTYTWHTVYGIIKIASSMCAWHALDLDVVPLKYKMLSLHGTYAYNSTRRKSCQVSLAMTWRLASRKRLLQVDCQPFFLKSSAHAPCAHWNQDEGLGIRVLGALFFETFLYNALQKLLFHMWNPAFFFLLLNTVLLTLVTQEAHKTYPIAVGRKNREPNSVWCRMSWNYVCVLAKSFSQTPQDFPTQDH